MTDEVQIVSTKYIKFITDYCDDKQVQYNGTIFVPDPGVWVHWFLRDFPDGTVMEHSVPAKATMDKVKSEIDKMEAYVYVDSEVQIR